MEEKKENEEKVIEEPKEQEEKKEEVVHQEQEEKKEVVQHEQDPVILPNENDIHYQQYKEDNKKDAKWLSIVIIILFVIGILGGLWLLLSDNKPASKKKEEPTSDVELKYTDTFQKNDGIYITDVSEIVESVMPSIVAITSKTLISNGYYGPGFFGGSSSKQYSTGAGSGIIVSKTDSELMILTNNHVIEDAESLSVQFINNKSVDAKVKGSSAAHDIAIITIPLKDIDKETLDSIKIATMGDSTKLKVGNGVIAIGNALGYGQSVTTGVVSALNREVTVDNTTASMIQIDAAINGGNSGGALLNSSGEVVGINSVKYSSNAYSSTASIEGMGFAIPISDVQDLIKTLMSGETLSEETRGYIGVSGYIITEEYNEAYDIPTGYLINSITKGSGADKAGLSIGNIIVEIDNQKITSSNDLTKAMELKKPGDKVKLKVKYAEGRSYKEKEVTVTLSSYDDVK